MFFQKLPFSLLTGVLVILALIAGWWYYDRYRIAPEPALASLPLTDLEGHALNPDQWAGKPVLINFWQTWCGPCRQEIPDLEAAKTALEAEGFVFAMVSDEPAALLGEFRNQFPGSLPLWRTASLKDIGVFTFPTTLLFNRQGEVVYKKVGMAEWSSPEMLNRFRELVR